jgi:predicted oxidoreductase
MQVNPFVQCLGTVRFQFFRKDNAQTRRLKKLLVTLMAKYHLGSDSILLGILHPAKIIPIAGINVARIQPSQKAIELKVR